MSPGVTERTATGPADADLRRHADVFRALGDAVVVTDVDGLVVDANPAAERMFGLPLAEMLGRFPGDSTPGSSAPAFATVRAHLETGAEWCSDLRLIDADGSRRTIVLTAVGVRSAGGRLIGTVGIHRDVTSERETALALGEAEERWRLTLDGAPSGIAIIALDGAFMNCNQALCRMLGYSEPEPAVHDVPEPHPPGRPRGRPDPARPGGDR
ncbi:hypothetical protein GCM10025868_21200 [Angustibacter aerolatus]|uniref:PAS domain-containing protein n=1 Tax=Angustibacter aerolatus TaxID=1162965 RepID=A0ABQ6JI07_9ACTN|nr:hypothetical protein GCM10025868_21200 [Angustibacter aerolatus]